MVCTNAYVLIILEQIRHKMRTKGNSHLTTEIMFSGVSWELYYEMWDLYSTVKVLQHWSNAYGYITCAPHSWCTPCPMCSFTYITASRAISGEEDSGWKFGALGPGRSTWAKSVAMQVHQTGGKKEDPLQCLLRTSSELSPAAISAQDQVRAISSSICK